jgi:hypothetical protein
LGPFPWERSSIQRGQIVIKLTRRVGFERLGHRLD